MSSFTNSPPLQLSPDGEMWTVAEDFEYRVGSEDSGEVIKVPKGFMSDGASIPKIFWSWIGGPTGRYFYAAVLHDWLYYKKIYKRAKADKIFYEAMGVLGVPNWKRSMMYMAVRMCAWISWNNRKPLVVVILLMFFLSGCASCDGRTFWGFGRYKTSEFEIESSPPLKDTISVNALRQ